MMKHNRWFSWMAVVLIILAVGMGGCGTKTKPTGDGALEIIRLPAPQTTGGKPLMEALRDRASNRNFSPDPLPEQVMSNMLWAAFGINRPESGKRNAPSALNWQETDIYVFTSNGVFLYEPAENVLLPVVSGDHRGKTGSVIQPFVKKAPVNLVYVVDAARTGIIGSAMGADSRDMFSNTAVGFISQNVYLYCASEGLATVVRGSFDRKALAELLALRPEQRIILAQSVGYPAE
jgi:nitroreductase